ncbi:transporter substrate-binding domain-containing protein [Actinomadura fulvescens]
MLLLTLASCTGKPPVQKSAPPQIGPFLGRDRTITVGVKPDQPQLSQQNGSRWDGFEIRLIDYLATKTGSNPIYTPVVTADRDSRLSNRQLHMIVANYSDTPQRRTKAELVGPYMVTPQGILVRAGDTSIRSFAEMKGKSVCTTTDSTSLDALKGAGIHISTQDRFEECVKQLEGKQVNAVSTDLLILYGFQHTSPKLAVALDRTSRPVEVPATASNKWMVGLQPGDGTDCQTVLNLVRSFLTDNTWELNFNTWFPHVQQVYKDWSTRFKPKLESLGCY